MLGVWLCCEWPISAGCAAFKPPCSSAKIAAAQPPPEETDCSESVGSSPSLVGAVHWLAGAKALGKGKGCRARKGLRNGEWRILSQLIGSREWIREVGNAEACADHRRSFAVEVVRQAKARSNVAVARLNAGSPANAVLACIIKHQRILVEVRQLVVLSPRPE